MEKLCEQCGKPFEAQTRKARFCPECRHLKFKEAGGRSLGTRKATAAYSSKKKAEIKRKMNALYNPDNYSRRHIDDVNLEAKKYGLDYGKYMAMKRLGLRIEGINA